MRGLCYSWSPGSVAPVLDRTDRRHIPDDELRRKVALGDQRPFAFSGTVASNLRLARPDADEAELWHVLEIVALADTSQATRLTERGANLSGGELQRLSLAQAPLPRPVICEGVTSQLDAPPKDGSSNGYAGELAGANSGYAASARPPGARRAAVPDFLWHGRTPRWPAW